jgi:hypothetical protein
MRRAAPVVLIVLLFPPGCGNSNGRVEQAQAIVEFEPRDSSVLVRPFSDEEIRNEWIPGFRLLMKRTYPEETRIERWTVVSADDEGVEIEYADIADDGSVEREPTVSHSEWTELRDHAAFPAAYSTREWVSRETALGYFEGWLYRVAKPGTAVISEFFFVPELPGAPVQMRTLEGDTIVFELEQTARMRPESD